MPRIAIAANGRFDNTYQTNSNISWRRKCASQFFNRGLLENMNVLKISLFFLYFSCTQQAFAHCPYYTQHEPLVTSEGSPIAIKLLHGDGIIGGDPVRAIVVDSDLRFRAISPLGRKLHIVCRQKENDRLCVVYNSVSNLVYELDHENWVIGSIIEDQGRPLHTAYPEEMGQGFGFKHRPATYLEIIKYEGDKIKSYPLLAGLTLLWWTLIALSFASLLWRLLQNKGRIKSITTQAAALILLRIMGAATLLSLTLAGWIWEPYSLYFAGFFAVLGTLLALIFTRPRQANNLQ